MAKTDQPPPGSVGHIALPTTDVAKTSEYLQKLGLRPIEQHDEVAVLELRGGTHLVVLKSDQTPAAGAKASFDLMYEDIDEIWQQCKSLGYAPSAIEERSFHRSFTIIEPGGHELTINSSHASNRPV